MKKGFTLLELLIVIAILAILAAAAVVVLNPAELLRRARDSERITDMANVRNALNLYLTTVSSIDLADANHAVADGCVGDGGTLTMYTHQSGAATSSAQGTGSILAITNTSTRTTDGTGWLPVNLGNTAGGSPLSSVPLDPTDDSTYYYIYMCNTSSSTYELGANMESSNYAAGGDDDVEGTDGGNASGWYEVGNDSGLDIGG